MNSMKTKRGNYDDKNLNESYVEKVPFRTLLKVATKKVYRRAAKVLGYHSDFEYAVNYNGVMVFGSRYLDGEGTTVGQDYIRVLLELGLKRCERIYEFCAGPGYIGYSLLANGFCEKLTLADINPKAVEIARRTAQINNISHLVNIYHSDCLDHIPDVERWDLVVSNPPHFLPSQESSIPKDPREKVKLTPKEASLRARNLKAFDPDWSIHKRFYSSVGRFMKPGGLVVMQENAMGSTADIFVPMIEAGGGTFTKEVQGIDICGKSNNMYYVVSQW